MHRDEIESLLERGEFVDWEETEYVGCDLPCFALRAPVTLAEYKLAHEHWERHGWMKGCSHGS